MKVTNEMINTKIASEKTSYYNRHPPIGKRMVHQPEAIARSNQSEHADHDRGRQVPLWFS